ncbi:MAG: hypothetical protein H6767_05405 [Candidatus Peribacteria bacterium]|nr:MAG: hypothetical protein H6767_05405 [Candidatus Peribacteria bacterium]
MIPTGMLATLKYLDASFSFVTIRVLTSFFILFIGIYILGDIVSIWNLIGFFIGIVAIFLLSGWHLHRGEKLPMK